MAKKRKQLVKNKTLNYWLCGLIFSLVFGAVDWLLSLIGEVWSFFGAVVYLLVMPYVAGRLADYVSDKWMD